MAKRQRLGVALLAAGSSRRFGSADKLAQPFRGRLLGEHAARAIPIERFKSAWVITSIGGHPCEPGWIDAGFEPVINPKAHEGLSASVVMAAELAEANRCDALLIALADMPLVSTGHFSALANLSTHGHDIFVSAWGDARMPPAIFGKDHFVTLSESEGDTGARDLLAAGTPVVCPPDWLIDIDTPEALQKYGQST